MKNVLSISAAGQDLLYSTDDGTNRLIINGAEIPSSSWAGTGTYTTTVEGHTVTITKASSLTGNLMLAQTGSYAYEFRNASSQSGGVTGVKGDQEAAYRSGDVNLTPAHIGAVDKTGDTMSGSLSVDGNVSSTESLIAGSSSRDSNVAVHAITNGRDMEILSQPSGGAGVYDSTNQKWVVFTLMDGTRGPLASSTENGFMSAAEKTKLAGLGVTGMNADGEALSISSGTNWTNLMSTGVTLAANHKYLCTYRVQWASSSTGRRATRATIGGSDAGVISQCVCPAANGAATVMGATFWIEPASSARTLNFQGYQDSNSARTATLRYQLIDFGT